ncbi:MAG: AAA family ATPase, partial [Thermodesulfobacteriota bacterium]|nr:AAA family ATPase [Thermodesulfobacteriota bacterium]
EDMFIITSEEAEKHVKPPELARIILNPLQTQLKPGAKQTFIAKGFDQFGRDIETGAVEWSATGGEIGHDGVFKAAEDEGNFIVSAKIGKISGAVDVRISKEPEPLLSEPQKAPGKPQRLIWSGEVTPQKWMNFYTKVLTKFVKAGSLKLNISIEATPKDGVADHQVKETKIALRELGLEEDVQVK